MLIPIPNLTKIWKVTPTSVLHVGAHMAEEEPLYRKYQWGHVTWIEAQPRLVDLLNERLDPQSNSVACAAVWDKSDIELELNIASNSQSTSLLEFGTHSLSYPDITFTEKIKVRTSTLESVLPKNYSPELINLDIQGVELRALKGFAQRLTGVKWIYCEVNAEEVYKDCTLLPELDHFLAQNGFTRIYTKWAPPGTWGDALYARAEDYTPLKVMFARVRQEIAYSLKSIKRNIVKLISNVRN